MLFFFDINKKTSSMKNVVKSGESIFLVFCQLDINRKMWYNKELGVKKKYENDFLFVIMKEISHIMHKGDWL